MANLPRGIRLVQWKNKDGRKSVRYRIRREIKNNEGITEVTDKSFDTLKEAEEFLKLSKTIRGKDLIYSISKEQEDKAREVKEFLLEPPMSFYIDRYIKKFIDTKDQSNYTKKRNVATLKIFYKSIKETKIEYRYIANNSIGGIIGALADYPKKTVGEFKVKEFGIAEINDFIRTRLQHITKKGTTLTKASVGREVSLFSVFYRHLQDGELDPKLLGCDNPVLKHNRKLLANANKKRKFVLTEQMEKTLFDELEKTNNKELYLIAKLSLYSALRRSEIIYLTWDKVDLVNSKLTRIQSKSSSERDVYLLPEALELLKNISKRENDPRVFKTNIAGFEGTFNKLIKRIFRSGEEKIDFRFHDLRRQAIRNLILRLAGITGNNNNSIIIAQLLGLSSAKKLEENHIHNQDFSNITNQKQAQKSIGHTGSDETLGYFNL